MLLKYIYTGTLPPPPPPFPFPSTFENAQKKMAKITAPAFMTHTHRRGEGRGEEEGKQTLNVFILYAFHRAYIQLTSSKTPTLMENHVGSFYE